MTRNLTTDQHEAIDQLRELLPEGSTVWTIVRHVSRSGMLRHISPFIITNQSYGPDTFVPHDLAYLVARAGIFTRPRDGEGLKIHGAGMDMGFHLVYTIGQVIHGDGYKLNHRWF
jgi:hypothetical protein